MLLLQVCFSTWIRRLPRTHLYSPGKQRQGNKETGRHNLRMKPPSLCLSLALLTGCFTYSASVRCYECRSDSLRNCGDPFVPNQVPATECYPHSSYPTVACFKSMLYVAGEYIVFRGCAPFNTDHFNEKYQRSMVGNYWRGRNLFSLCDYDNCNGSEKSVRALSWLSILALALTTKLLSN